MLSVLIRSDSATYIFVEKKEKYQYFLIENKTTKNILSRAMLFIATEKYKWSYPKNITITKHCIPEGPKEVEMRNKNTCTTEKLP